MSEALYIGIDGVRFEATGETLDYILNTQSELQAVEEAIQAEKEAKAQAQASAVSKLKALGLTAEEIAALKI